MKRPVQEVEVEKKKGNVIRRSREGSSRVFATTRKENGHHRLSGVCNTRLEGLVLRTKRKRRKNQTRALLLSTWCWI